MRFKNELNDYADMLPESPLQGSERTRLDKGVYLDDSDESGAVSSCIETQEGCLSRSLQSWMVHHEWSDVEPLERPPEEPVFSGKLGTERQWPKKKREILKGRKYEGHINKRCKPSSIRRVPSDESIHTNLSLLTCSSLETPVVEINDAKDKCQNKVKIASRSSSSTSQTSPTISKWDKVSTRSSGLLSRLFRTHDVLYGYVAGGIDDDESEAFYMMDKDEQTSLCDCRMTRGIKYVDKSILQRSFSLNELHKSYSQKPHRRQLKRVLSASATQSWGRPINIAEIKRERMNRLIACEQANVIQEKRPQKGRRHNITRSSSMKSLSAAPNTRPTSPITKNVTTAISNVCSVISERNSDIRADSPTDSDSQVNTEEETISVWKGDRQILEIDLNKELTQRVKRKIDTTRLALKRATGYGDDNEQKIFVGSQDEYPKHIDEDFSYKPRIIQKMRISPHLSGIIHDDIQVRMGRPRYHEIRVTDLDQWNKGQELNRAHRNLKVFNWLHSLRDVQFKNTNVIPIIDDALPDEHSLELIHVESAEEPDVAPLFRHLDVRIL